MADREYPQTEVMDGLGIVIVDRVLPSGSKLVRDCMGRHWLVADDAEAREAVEVSVNIYNYVKDTISEKRVGPAGKGGGKRGLRRKGP